MTNLKLRVVCAHCNDVSEIIEIEVYPKRKEDNLSPVFRWLFQAKWLISGLEILCPDCAERSAVAERKE